jgi:hypothetical protein
MQGISYQHLTGGYGRRMKKACKLAQLTRFEQTERRDRKIVLGEIAEHLRGINPSLWASASHKSVGAPTLQPLAKADSWDKIGTSLRPSGSAERLPGEKRALGEKTKTDRSMTSPQVAPVGSDRLCTG